MSKPDRAAYFVAYNVGADDVLDELSEDELGHITVRLHNLLEEAGLDPSGVALVTGERAEELEDLDSTMW